MDADANSCHKLAWNCSLGEASPTAKKKKKKDRKVSHYIIWKFVLQQSETIQSKPGTIRKKKKFCAERQTFKELLQRLMDLKADSLESGEWKKKGREMDQSENNFAGKRQWRGSDWEDSTCDGVWPIAGGLLEDSLWLDWQRCVCAAWESGHVLGATVRLTARRTHLHRNLSSNSCWMLGFSAAVAAALHLETGSRIPHSESFCFLSMLQKTLHVVIYTDAFRACGLSVLLLWVISPRTDDVTSRGDINGAAVESLKSEVYNLWLEDEGNKVF